MQVDLYAGCWNEERVLKPGRRLTTKGAYRTGAEVSKQKIDKQ
jgi:hypothetical protein